MIEQLPYPESVPQLPEGYWYHPEGYAWLVLPLEPFAGLPTTVQTEASVLEKKTEFHVTVMNVRGVAGLIAHGDTALRERVEQEILASLREYVREHPIIFSGFRDDLRLAKKDDRVSIAARCDVRGVEDFFVEIERRYGIAIERQPSHVSLYTLPGKGAVGIDSDEQMECYEEIKKPEVSVILKAMSVLA